jgi:hypothetical protein
MPKSEYDQKEKGTVEISSNIPISALVGVLIKGLWYVLSTGKENETLPLPLGEYDLVIPEKDFENTPGDIHFQLAVDDENNIHLILTNQKEEVN